jgi:nitrate reductase NapE component
MWVTLFAVSFCAISHGLNPVYAYACFDGNLRNRNESEWSRFCLLETGWWPLTAPDVFLSFHFMTYFLFNVYSIGEVTNRWKGITPKLG